MQILDGRALSQKIELEITNEVKMLKEKCGCTPGLAVVLVGQDPASATYVNMKKKACDRVGFYSITHDMPETISQEAIEKTIEELGGTMPENLPVAKSIKKQLKEKRKELGDEK